ncbi:unnamed protein product, partial [Ectocarpus fasciculatus]
GNQLNYAATGVTLLGEGGGGFFNKRDTAWFKESEPFRLSMQNPHETHVDTGMNSFKADVCKQAFKSTSLRLKCAIQRDIRAGKNGGKGAETGGFLKYCVDPGGELMNRVLPPPTFCTRSFDEDGGADDTTKQALKEMAEELMKKHGGGGGESG